MSPPATASGPLNGAIPETAVLSEISKTLLHRGEEPRLYFWHTAKGVEVDLLVEVGQKLIPVEVKASATPRPKWREPSVASTPIFNKAEDLDCEPLTRLISPQREALRMP